ncbi:methionyl-tRNA formyltransferase [Heyndrickxia oleronia]|jgi:methionyl-tRNA formyltransferase|uniref:Methionyl-tRNA formyltransferase n=1 Tax=Heyndrickxia oleronia TaxID=38875 RepID=A0A8E2I9P8_9BACI|nr:methionyl-tRNA formyltransferase [Heyndrickxia oleronia]MBU5211012.1 methionyl-tRNA formyltransferase [Heyndrickxia oleronia]MCM3454235.1 methionyl-tRNA formyltransferase [Heyndrickxia oleronia]MEC1376113.1 methionyl-tRNA formyltransferase [Heyndrickxia oleronia]OOP69239.1 methionyl-tRNA formyltransferase [Heyndrickxia oleronia]QQZ03267.1 methionyl-tRNA formyltransferase [Heyndrickxia oleronia]
MTKVVFMGTPDFSVPVLERIIQDGYEVLAVVTQPDRPVGRKRILTPTPVKVEAEKHQIPVYQPEKLRGSEELNTIIKLKPDIVITAAYGQILPKDLLDAPELGCINVHASLLPELRGGAPIHYAIMQGKKKTGITIMYMAEKLDAGDIISQVEVPITEEDNVGTLHIKLSKAGANLLSDTLPKLINHELTSIPQNHELATFASNIKREQEKIDWSKTGEDIYNHIRGLNPWPVAYTTLNGNVMKIWESKKVSLSEQHPAGSIVEKEKDGIVVATGNLTGIKITELQPSGKKKMSGEQFLNGTGSTLPIGTILGE